MAGWEVHSSHTGPSVRATLIGILYKEGIRTQGRGVPLAGVGGGARAGREGPGLRATSPTIAL